jgi:hypothetical protein
VADDERDDERDDAAAEPATEGDAAWRARTQEQSPPADEVAPPTPRDIDPDDNRHP